MRQSRCGMRLQCLLNWDRPSAPPAIGGTGTASPPRQGRKQRNRRISPFRDSDPNAHGCVEYLVQEVRSAERALGVSVAAIRADRA